MQKINGKFSPAAQNNSEGPNKFPSNNHAVSSSDRSPFWKNLREEIKKIGEDVSGKSLTRESKKSEPDHAIDGLEYGFKSPLQILNQNSGQNISNVSLSSDSTDSKYNHTHEKDVKSSEDSINETDPMLSANTCTMNDNNNKQIDKFKQRTSLKTRKTHKNGNNLNTLSSRTSFPFLGVTIGKGKQNFAMLRKSDPIRKIPKKRGFTYKRSKNDKDSVTYQQTHEPRTWTPDSYNDFDGNTRKSGDAETVDSISISKTLGAIKMNPLLHNNNHLVHTTSQNSLSNNPNLNANINSKYGKASHINSGNTNKTNNNSNSTLYMMSHHDKNVATVKTYIKSVFQPADNKLAIKLFGSKKAVMQERMRQTQSGHSWVIHPCSHFRFYWDVFMLFLLAANLIILPVTITFFNNDLSIYWLVFNCFSDTMFLCDIVVNFRTGIMPEDKTEHIILDPKIIARHYAKTWFILDFLSSFPFDYFLLIFNPYLIQTDGHKFQMIQAGRALRILRLAKLLSLLRLLRVSRLVRYVSQWEEVYFLNLATVFIRIFNLVSIMLLVGHWSGCLQFLVPQMQGFPHDCWIVIANIEKSDWFEQYSWSFFKAMSHMLSIGYGRFPPQNLTDMWLTIFSMVSGATCYALFIGHATNLIQSLESANRQYRELMKQVDEYMAYRKLPRSLKVKIQDYFEHKYHGKMFNESMILRELSDTLRRAVVNHNCRELVASVPFFANADENFVNAIIGNLEYEVFQPGDIIVKEGALGDKMYFIQEGVVDVITGGEIKTSLSEGSYFGEICLMTSDQKRQATIQAASYCHLFSLSRLHFNQVLENYPMMRKTMESIAAERLTKIGRDPTIVSPREDLSSYLETVHEVLKAKEKEILALQSAAASINSSNHNTFSFASKGSTGLIIPKNELLVGGKSPFTSNAGIVSNSGLLSALNLNHYLNIGSIGKTPLNNINNPYLKHKMSHNLTAPSLALLMSNANRGNDALGFHKLFPFANFDAVSQQNLEGEDKELMAETRKSQSSTKEENSSEHSIFSLGKLKTGKDKSKRFGDTNKTSSGANLPKNLLTVLRKGTSGSIKRSSRKSSLNPRHSTVSTSVIECIGSGKNYDESSQIVNNFSQNYESPQDFAESKTNSTLLLANGPKNDTFISGKFFKASLFNQQPLTKNLVNVSASALFPLLISTSKEPAIQDAQKTGITKCYNKDSEKYITGQNLTLKKSMEHHHFCSENNLYHLNTNNENANNANKSSANQSIINPCGIQIIFSPPSTEKLVQN